MSETENEPVMSDLWTFYTIATHSTYFPKLVQGAALMEGVPYNDALLHFVASRPAVIENMRVGFDQNPDIRITELLRLNPTGVDTVIKGAVAAYTPPTPEQ